MYFALLLALIANAAVADQPRLESLVGREFLVEDDWAGQSFTLQRNGESLQAVWRVLGSGRPVVSEKVYPVEMQGDRMGKFRVLLGSAMTDPRAHPAEITILLPVDAPMKVYLNGVRIVVEERAPQKRP